MPIQDWWNPLLRSREDVLVTPSERLSRQDLAGLVRHLCAHFDRMGLREGDRIVIRTKDEAAAIVAFSAALFDGIVPVMLTEDTPPERAAAVAALVAPEAAVIDADKSSEAWLSGISNPLPLVTSAARRSWFAGRTRPAERLFQAFGLDASERPPRLPADPDGLAYLLFTSGTTSLPSGVMITRRNLLANVATIARILDVRPGARVFNDMVLAHGDGLVQGPMLALGAQATLVRGGGFALDRIEDWLDTAKREAATHFLTVPTVWSMIDRYARHDDYFAHDGFVGLSSVAAALDPGLWERIETRFGRPLTNQYGLTETVASAVYAGPSPEAGSRFSVGRPVDCLARIVSLAGAPDDADDRGELQLKGDNIFAGYWRDPAKTEATFTEDGWMRTGDIARQDAAGDLHIVGRIKTIIMTGGFLIRPEELDEALCRCPGVTAAVTVGCPDDVFGEIAVSLVETDDPALDEAALARHAATTLEQRKVPKRIFPVAQIPRGPAGKPRLDAVRTTVASLLQTRPADMPVAAGDDLEAEVLRTAARVFRVDPAQLSPRSSPDTVKGWDSFQQVSLIIALEDRFSVSIPTARAAAIRTLASAADAIRAARKA